MCVLFFRCDAYTFRLLGNKIRAHKVSGFTHLENTAKCIAYVSEARRRTLCVELTVKLTWPRVPHERYLRSEFSALAALQCQLHSARCRTSEALQTSRHTPCDSLSSAIASTHPRSAVFGITTLKFVLVARVFVCACACFTTRARLYDAYNHNSRSPSWENRGIMHVSTESQRVESKEMENIALYSTQCNLSREVNSMYTIVPVHQHNISLREISKFNIMAHKGRRSCGF